MQDKKLLRPALWALGVILSAALLWAAMKYLLPCFLPFLLAFFTARLIAPAVSLLRRRLHFTKAFSSAVCAMTVFLSLAGILVFAGQRLVYQAAELLRELPGLLTWIPGLIQSLTAKADRYMASAPYEVRMYMDEAMANFSGRIAEFPAELSARALSFLSDRAANASGAAVFMVTYAVGVIFISRSYDEIKQFFLNQIPISKQETALKIKDDLLHGFTGWLRAELTLVGITFSELALALSVLGFRYALLLSVFIALVDMLPVLGTGTVLVPWAAVLALRGEYVRAAALVILWIICTAARSFLEPKLVGRSISLDPAASLFAVYLGFKCFGVAGMVLFPLGLVLLKTLNDNGYIRLWK